MSNAFAVLIIACLLTGCGRMPGMRASEKRASWFHARSSKAKKKTRLLECVIPKEPGRLRFRACFEVVSMGN